MRSIILLFLLVLSGCAHFDSIKQPNLDQNGINNSKNAQHSPETQLSQTIKPHASHQAINIDNVSIDTLTTDHRNIWNRIRNGFTLEALDSPLAETQTNWYAARSDYFQRMTERSRLYLFHIVEELSKRNMPMEIALLPFVESAFNPAALSVAKASGVWQFMPMTGLDFNLKQNMFRDERRDIIASTDAALDYLTRLHGMFGDWFLALAAYNWGEGNIQRSINRNLASGLPADYTNLKLPQETRNYIPKLQAIKNIILNPKQYNVVLPHVPNHPYFITVTTARDIDVDIAAKLASLDLDEFIALNPSFNKPIILGATSPQILLPFENAKVFEHNLKQYKQPLSSWTTYRVTQSERPTALANKLSVDVKTLLSVNKIPSGMHLKPGSTILIPKVGNEDDIQDISAAIAENAVLIFEPDRPATRKMLVRVKSKQSIQTFAKRYGIQVAQIRQWNRKIASHTLPAGSRIVLHVPVTQNYARARPIQTAIVASKIKRVSLNQAKKVNRQSISKTKSKSVKTNKMNTRSNQKQTIQKVSTNQNKIKKKKPI